MKNFFSIHDIEESERSLEIHVVVGDFSQV